MQQNSSERSSQQYTYIKSKIPNKQPLLEKENKLSLRLAGGKIKIRAEINETANRKQQKRFTNKGLVL